MERAASGVDYCTGSLWSVDTGGSGPDRRRGASTGPQPGSGLPCCLEPFPDFTPGPQANASAADRGCDLENALPGKLRSGTAIATGDVIMTFMVSLCLRGELPVHAPHLLRLLRCLLLSIEPKQAKIAKKECTAQAFDHSPSNSTAKPPRTPGGWAHRILNATRVLILRTPPYPSAPSV